MHIGRRDENVEILECPDRVEIDKALDQAFERIDVERIEIVRREHARHGVDHEADRRGFHRHQRQHAVEHRALRARQVAADRGRAPEFGEPLARLFAAAARKTVGEHHRVHGAGGRAGHARDMDAAVFQQMIDHAPGEGAMRAAALKRQIDLLFPGAAPEVPATFFEVSALL